ncbi:ubiquitin-related modifier 1 isoform X1 [Phodopus roborovskii]|uniref:ubiquitin-related modifier 1 isoform X1 n=1 Tax=Phodopus roborovskii TaxID=109678 RepID=UPI0021E4F4F1|nr:ubiquitin-related modifier 1 isoform X1 [Phodopus roborovskii]
MAAPLCVEVEFGGGAELLFDGVKKHQVTLPGQEGPWDIRNLLVWIKKNLLKERPELFIQGESVTDCTNHIWVPPLCASFFTAEIGKWKADAINWRMLPADTGHPQRRRRRKQARMRMAALVARTS